MTTPDKPIQEQVNRALNIFRDPFRDFVVRRLQTVRGRQPAEVIIDALRGQARDSALTARARGDDVRNMFDVGNFYFIVRDNWRDLFADDFQNDRSVLSALSQIGNIRNAASHSQYGRDVRRETAMSRIWDMADILGTINAASAQAAVQEIWDDLDKMRVETPAPAPAPSAAQPAAPAASPSASSPSDTMAMQPDVARSMAWVVVTRGPSEGKSIQLKEGNNTVGRAFDSDLQIDDASVSRSHAMVSVKGEEFTLIDLGSASGTRIGEYSIAGRRVSAGSEIAVGNTRLSLVNVDVTHGAPSSGDTIVGMSSGHSLALIAQSGPDAGRSFPLPSAQNIIGRDPTAQVSLSDPTVSRRHAMASVGADRATISDLGSMSGTAVNGEVIKGVRISVGDRIVVGQSEFTLMKPSV